ncbi:Wzz/FepE/Etk N-terminal domain-containing protein [Candidatus Latescibacterota bacterium]
MTEENNVQSYEDEDAFEFNITDWIAFFWNNIFTFIKFMTVAFIIGVIVALSLPKQYTAVATILPPPSSNNSSMLTRVRQFTGNFSVGITGLNMLYPQIALSRTILLEVLNATYEGQTYLNILNDKYNIDNERDNINIIENILNLLREQIQIDVDRNTSTVTLKVTANDPILAASLTNEILNQIDNYLRYRLKNAASGQVEMIYSRLESLSDSLKTAEDKLLSFKESNRMTNLSPTLQLTEMRLLRKVELNSAVYIELAKQLEVVKVEENQLKPILNVLDKANPPIQKSAPNRKNIVLIFLLAGFILAFLYLKVYP